MKLLYIKNLLVITGLFFTLSVLAEDNIVESKVYQWIEPTIESPAQLIFEGNTIDLKDLQVYSYSLQPGNSFPKDFIKEGNEVLIIVKEGGLDVKIKDEENVLSPGSVALFYPGENFEVKNIGEAPVEYYVMQYQSKSPENICESEQADGSFMLEWNNLEFHPHDKGGIRKYFEKPTDQIKRFEMHVTTLNAGIKSHEPHTHRAAEIVLMINGNTDMQIGEKFYDGTDGDLYFLGSNVPHAIKNIGDESCMYFAFQFE